MSAPESMSGECHGVVVRVRMPRATRATFWIILEQSSNGYWYPYSGAGRYSCRADADHWIDRIGDKGKAWAVARIDGPPNARRIK